jgi:hypothetical protein
MLFVLKTTYLIMRQHLLRLGKYSQDLPTFAKHFGEDSPDSPTFAKPCCEDLPKAIFEKNVTRLAKSARVMSNVHKVNN